MHQIFTNTEEKGKDRLASFLNREAARSNLARIATAYFTHPGLRNTFFLKPEVRLIVGVRGAVDVSELRRLLKQENVSIRYYYRHFHPKLYIFSSGVAVVGSSNFTYPGLGSDTSKHANRECNIATNDVEVLSQVSDYFDALWENAGLVTEDTVNQIESLSKQVSSITIEADKAYEAAKHYLDFEVYQLSSSLQDVGKYDEFTKEFAELVLLYRDELGSLSELPDYLEIDQFLSWLYDNYREDPAGPIHSKQERAQTVRRYLRMFQEDADREHKYFDHVRQNPLYIEKLLTKASIASLTEDEARTIALNIQSLGARYADIFLKENNLQSIRRTFDYLLFGSDDVKVRLRECLQGRYKLKIFAESRARELLGWAANDYPIWNHRVALSMSILGYNKIHRTHTKGLRDRLTNSRQKA